MALPLQKSRPTQKDIARELGISQATVAMALNTKTQIKLTPETVALVQAKAAEMNYSPQRQASILRSGRSHTIGVVFIAGVYHAPQERVKYLAQAAIQQGYQLIAVDLDWFNRDIDQAVRYLRGSAAEGVVLCNLNEDPTANWRKLEPDLPTISMNSGPDNVGHRVSVDIEDAFYHLTRHHMELGSRYLSLLLPFHDLHAAAPIAPTIKSRICGFQRAIAESGGEIFCPDAFAADLLSLPYATHSTRTFSGEVCFHQKIADFIDAFQLGYWHMEQILKSGRDLPESIVCSSDHSAIGLLQACQDFDIAVPDVVKVSGADDAPFAPYCGIPLTTVAQESEAMAHYCIQRIVQLIEDPSLRALPIDQKFSFTLIPRRSTIGR